MADSGSFNPGHPVFPGGQKRYNALMLVRVFAGIVFLAGFLAASNDEKIREYREYLTHFASDVAVLNNLALIYIEEKNFGEADVLLRKSLKVRHDKKAFFNLAVLYASQGKELALQDYLSSVTVPEDAETLALGLMNLGKGKPACDLPAVLAKASYLTKNTREILMVHAAWSCDESKGLPSPGDLPPLEKAMAYSLKGDGAILDHTGSLDEEWAKVFYAVALLDAGRVGEAANELSQYVVHAEKSGNCLAAETYLCLLQIAKKTGDYNLYLQTFARLARVHKSYSQKLDDFRASYLKVYPEDEAELPTLDSPVPDCTK